MRASLGTTDANPWITRLSLAGLITAALLAVVGGMPFDLPMPTHGIGLVTPTCGLTRVNRSRQRRRSAGLAL